MCILSIRFILCMFLLKSVMWLLLPMTTARLAGALHLRLTFSGPSGPLFTISSTSFLHFSTYNTYCLGVWGNNMFPQAMYSYIAINFNKRGHRSPHLSWFYDVLIILIQLYYTSLVPNHRAGYFSIGPMRLGAGRAEVKLSNRRAANWVNFITRRIPPFLLGKMF